MVDVLALVGDLFFQAKLAETARHLGVSLRTVSSGDALVQEAAAQTPRLVLVDLNARQGALAALERLCAAGQAQTIVAFLSHAQTELAQRARAAGCREVLPRSQFTAELAGILLRAKS